MHSLPKRNIVFLLSLLCVTTFHKPLKAQNDYIVPILATSGMLASAYMFYNWWTQPTDEEVLERAENAYHAVLKNNHQLISECYQALEARSLSENELCIIAENILTGRTIHSWIDCTMHDIRALKKNYAVATARLAAMDTSNYLYQPTKSLVVNMSELSRNLTIIRDCVLKKHTPYFIAYKNYAQLVGEYGDALRMLNSSLDHSLAKNLRGCIASYQVTHQCNYPYIDYVQDLTDDVDSFASIIKQLSRTYPQMFQQTTQLKKNLLLIKHAVMSDAEYTRSLRDYERDRLHQEQLALQREMQRQQEQLQQQQALLIAQNIALAHEVAKPKPVVIVEREYVRPAVTPQIIVHHTPAPKPAAPVIIHHHHEAPPAPAPVVIHHTTVAPSAPELPTGHESYSRESYQQAKKDSDDAYNNSYSYQAAPVESYAAETPSGHESYTHQSYQAAKKESEEESLVDDHYDDNYDNN